MPRPELAALIHGPAELLPISSSAHASLVGDRESAVGLHLASAAGLLVGRWREVAAVLRRLDFRRVAMHLLAGAVPSAAGLLLRRRTPPSPVAGLLVGSAGLLLADRQAGDRSRWDAGPADGFWLGVAQACALVPGVSRNAATLVVARLRGFGPEEANRLSREVGLPVTLGAVALEGRVAPAPSAVAFLATLGALPLLRLVDRGPLWPWAAYRCVLALVLMRRSHR